MSQSLKDDRKLKAFRQSTHSSQKASHSRKPADQKDTINFDCSSLNEDSGKAQNHK